MGFDVWGATFCWTAPSAPAPPLFQKILRRGYGGVFELPGRPGGSLGQRSPAPDLALSFHCIGELGVTQALDAMEKALAAHPEKASSHRLRLEHFGFPTQGGHRPLREDGDPCQHPAVLHPSFAAARERYTVPGWAKEERGGYPSRRMPDAGIVLRGGSDSDVTPMDALWDPRGGQPALSGKRRHPV